MKKVLFVMMLLLSALVINAQTTTKTTNPPAAASTTASTHTPVNVADLPKAITDNIAKDFAGYTVKSATSVMENNEMTYHVKVTNGTSNETLIYDKNGKFVKKHTPSSEKPKK
jgi:hypothetical protein